MRKYKRIFVGVLGFPGKGIYPVEKFMEYDSFANLVDFAALWGYRRDVNGYGKNGKIYIKTIVKGERIWQN